MTEGQIEYRHYLQSWRWRIISATRKWRDGYQCRTCHETKRLQAHHASYMYRGAFGITGIVKEFFDTITLCDECHKRIHDRRNIQEFAD